ncbi:unnamed protein product [Mytilus edulis]|uniref:Reverse transcriptase zinc-binding domain-containing protein n=1 Tax=Mytilus edulis TaxID=6550 RepID=A0A8S3T3U3_MYTED|nr:unnamed protein product [Mytilus edulis]
MKERTNTKNFKVNWNKVDKNEYKTLIDDKLEKIKPISEKLNLDQAFDELNKILSDTISKIAPRKRKGKKKKKLPVMNDEILHAVKRKKTAFYIWKQQGRPKEPGNFYLKEKTTTTYDLRKLCRKEQALERINTRQQILDAKSSDTAIFYKLIRKQRGKMGRFIDELIVENETYQTSDSVLEGWTKHFGDLAKKSNYHNFDQNHLEAVEVETEIILKICKENYSHEKVSIQELKNALTKIEWKRFITKKIHKYWEGAIKTRMKEYSTLRYLKCEYDIGRIHPLLKTSSANITEIKKLSICTKLVTGTYILQSNKAEYSNYATNPMCRLCNKADETIEHFILLCETTSQIRSSLIVKILHEGSLAIARESLQTPIDLITLIINPYHYLPKKMCKDVEDRVEPNVEPSTSITDETQKVNDKGNAVVATRFGQLLGTFGTNEMGICKQNLILEEEINCETTLSVREAATHQSLSGGQGFFKCSCKSKCLSNRHSTVWGTETIEVHDYASNATHTENLLGQFGIEYFNILGHNGPSSGFFLVFGALHEL